MHEYINAYKCEQVHTHIDAYKYIVHEDANWFGCGGRHGDRHCRRCREGIVETLALVVIVTGQREHLRTTGPGPRTTLDLTHI
jgi:hypothetical protein